MSTGVAAALAAKRRDERDALDPMGAVRRNHLRALVSLLVTAIWCGAALIVVTTVAPAAFRVLPTRTLAGALVGQVLPVLFVAGLFVGVLFVRFDRHCGEPATRSHSDEAPHQE